MISISNVQVSDWEAECSSTWVCLLWWEQACAPTWPPYSPPTAQATPPLKTSSRPSSPHPLLSLSDSALSLHQLICLSVSSLAVCLSVCQSVSLSAVCLSAVSQSVGLSVCRSVSCCVCCLTDWQEKIRQTCDGNTIKDDTVLQEAAFWCFGGGVELSRSAVDRICYNNRAADVEVFAHKAMRHPMNLHFSSVWLSYCLL